MKIKPQPNIVYLKTEVPKVGALNIAGKPSGIEYAEILEVGEGVTNLKKGDHVFVKAWAIDMITYKDETYRFCSVETNGILAIVK